MVSANTAGDVVAEFILRFEIAAPASVRPALDLCEGRAPCAAQTGRP